MQADKRSLLANLSLGQRVAEEEREQLASYFVETDQWQKVLSGQIDVIFGPKGAGKSALYFALVAHEPWFRAENTILVSAEQPQGTPAFKTFVSDPPTSEAEFVGVWKLYVLSLIGSAFVQHGVDTAAAMRVRSTLAMEGLLPANTASLSARVKMVVEYVRRLLPRPSVEPTVHIDAAGNLAGFGMKIALSEPSEAERASGVQSVDALLGDANRALSDRGLRIWILFDRLDVAFAESRQLEANALRGLFKCYLDLMAATSIGFKIFLRTDIWNAITEGGFREASHITRKITISWSEPTLLNRILWCDDFSAMRRWLPSWAYSRRRSWLALKSSGGFSIASFLNGWT